MLLSTKKISLVILQKQSFTQKWMPFRQKCISLHNSVQKGRVHLVCINITYTTATQIPHSKSYKYACEITSHRHYVNEQF